MKETIIGAVAFVSMLFLAIFFANLVGAQNSGDAGSSLAEQNLAGERDQNLDRVNVNIKGTSATPTPASADRCVIRCDATADALSVSISGGAYEAIAGTGVACQCAAAGSNSTAVGVAAAATGSGSIAIGAGNSTNDIGGVCIGSVAACDGDQSVQIGGAVTASGDPDDSVAIGYLAEVTGDNATAVGSQASAAENAICIGKSCVAATQSGIGIGVSAAPAGGICLGRACASTDNTVVFGSSSHAITALFLGNGMTNATPTTVAFRGTRGVGTNIIGGSFELLPGAGTGNAKGGDVFVDYCPPGASGTATNGCTVGWTFDGGTGVLRGSSAVSFGEVADPIPTTYLEDVSIAEVLIAPQGTTQTVAAGDTITHNSLIKSIDSAGNITMTGTPTMTNGIADQLLILRNDGSFDITLQHGTSFNLRVDGGVSITLHPGDAVIFIMNSTLGDWFQVGAVSHNHV